MTKATRKLPTVLAAVAMLTSLLNTNVLAAANNVESVRNVVAAFATTWNRKIWIPSVSSLLRTPISSTWPVCYGQAGSQSRRSMPTSTA